MTKVMFLCGQANLKVIDVGEGHRPYYRVPTQQPTYYGMLPDTPPDSCFEYDEYIRHTIYIKTPSLYADTEDWWAEYPVYVLNQFNYEIALRHLILLAHGFATWALLFRGYR